MSPEHSPTDAAFLAELLVLALAPDPFGSALERTLAHLAADSGTIHLREGDYLRLCAHSAGMPAAVVELIRVIPLGKGMAGLAAQRREPVTACNLQTDQSGDVRPGARATGLQGSIVVPMLRSDEVVGTLGVANHAERTFDAREVALLLAIGRTLAGWQRPCA